MIFFVAFNFFADNCFDGCQSDLLRPLLTKEHVMKNEFLGIDWLFHINVLHKWSITLFEFCQEQNYERINSNNNLNHLYSMA